uniref:Beta-galactosidase n=1 Tax=Wollemia nobilis TaxID=56998 RepID=A0A0C9RYA0_9CONI
MELFRKLSLALVSVFLFSVLHQWQSVSGATVTYDKKSILIDGQRTLLISGSIHYPRSTPEMWPDIIQKAKDGGLDVIETYVFWNGHEPVQNQYNFEGRFDLVKFIKTVQQAGLYAHLRIGPYACAEWNYGGFPVWLHLIPGIQFRTDNGPFKTEMERFTKKIVDMMKQEKLWASQGGPIILAQIENEYGNIDGPYGEAGKRYIKWAASMAVGLNTGVPWVMCQQADAPDSVINTCNGFYCDSFTPNSPSKPKMWTENWSGWFLSFGGRVPYRPTEDLAFAVARFFQRGGTFQNYYMYHGGTNFGRASGGPFIATSYDYDAPIDEYGLLRQPKYGFLKELHKAIKLCEAALLNAEPMYNKLGSAQEAYVYKVGQGTCAAFLANIDTHSDATVMFNGNSYHLPAWSVSILPDCKNVILNTAQITSQATSVQMKFINSTLGTSSSKKMVGSEMVSPNWSWLKEPIGTWGSNAFSKSTLLEQINTTGDSTDYLWYTTSIQAEGDTQPVLHVQSLGHNLHVFINGQYTGSQVGFSSGSSITFEKPITLNSGKNGIDILSMTVGLQNYGSFFDTWGAGITGPVKLKGKDGERDLSTEQWTYQIGLQGEQLQFYTGKSTSNAPWTSGADLPKNQPMMWYKTTFDAPDGSDPVAINLRGMGKGVAWVNGESIGRYWPTYTSPASGCTDSCDYRGAYSADKCRKNCGQPSQELYHIPRSWIKPTGNVLVLFEEVGGDPTQISFMTRTVQILCAHVSETHLPPVDSWQSSAKNGSDGNRLKPEIQLHCPSSGQVISSIKFASFGTPKGECGSFKHGRCKSNTAMPIVQQACIGHESCSVEVSIENFGDPCKGTNKHLAVEASCS